MTKRVPNPLSTSLTLRLNEYEMRDLKILANKARLTISEMARFFIRNGLNGQDPHHDELVRRLTQLQESVASNLELTAGVLAATALLNDDGGGTEEAAKELTRKHLRRSMGIGKSVRAMQESGLFDSKESQEELEESKGRWPH